MTVISHKYKYIFIHISKNAGSSVSRLLQSKEDHHFLKQSLRRIGARLPIRVTSIDLFNSIEPGRASRSIGFSFFPPHAKALDLKKHLPFHLFDSYFKFAVIRNPWDRCVSRYVYFKKINKKYKELSFKEFLEQQQKLDHISQARFIFDECGNNLLDKLIKFENLEDDLKIITDKLSIPVATEISHANSSRHKDDYRKYYTNDELIELVAKNAAKDIDYFGYSF